METIATDPSTCPARRPSANNEDSLDQPRHAIIGLVRRLCTGAEYADERREHTRYPIAVPVSVTPLTAELCAAGAPVTMMTMNVSLGGAALIHKDDCDATLVALNFAPAGVQCAPVVMRILRNSRIGPMHVIGGEFVGAWSPEK